VILPWESSLPLRSGLVVLGVFSRTAGQDDFASDCPFCCWLELFPEFELDWLGVLDGVVLGLVLPSQAVLYPPPHILSGSNHILTIPIKF